MYVSTTGEVISTPWARSQHNLASSFGYASTTTPTKIPFSLSAIKGISGLTYNSTDRVFTNTSGQTIALLLTFTIVHNLNNAATLCAYVRIIKGSSEMGTISLPTLTYANGTAETHSITLFMNVGAGETLYVDGRGASTSVVVGNTWLVLCEN